MENNTKLEKIDSESKEVKKKQRKAIFALILEISGFSLLVYVNWLIALGAFLVIWGANIIDGLTFEEDVCRIFNGIIDKFISKEMREKIDEAVKNEE